MTQSSKRQKASNPSILTNAVDLVEYLTAKQPSGELTDSDKAFFAHVVALHSILVQVTAPRTWWGSYEGTVGSQAQDLVKLLGSRLGDAVRHLEHITCTSTNKIVQPFISQSRELYAGGIRMDRTNEIHLQKSKIYAYVLLNYRKPGFRQYQQQLKKLIPAELNHAIKEFNLILQDEADREEFLRQVKSQER